MTEANINRVLVTGGAGFVGSSLAVRLRRELGGAEVLCLDNMYRRGSELNRQRIERAGCEFVRGDVRDRAAFEMRPCDLVIDAAAEPSVLAGWAGSDVRYVLDTNLGGTLNVLEAARAWGARVLFLSTSRVYPVAALRSIRLKSAEDRFELDMDGAQPAGLSAAGIAESFSLEGARTLYGATKYASEVMVGEYAAQFGVRALIDRCGVIAGPWQMGKVDQGVVTLWVAAHQYGRALKYIGYEGRQVRDMVHVEDLCDLVVKQLACAGCWDGRVYSVGGGLAVSASLRELTRLAGAATGRRLEIGVDAQVRDGDVPWYVTDATRAGAAFGWRPKRTVADIVADTVEWLRSNEEALRPVLGG